MSTSIPVTAVFLSYNNADFIAEALESVLHQTYTPLEIIICDDASSDNSFAIAERIAGEYTGPHEVRLVRNVQNLGLIGNYNHVFGLAKGELVVITHGDDVAKPDRVDRIVHHYLKSDCTARHLISAFDVIDADGQSVGVSRALPHAIDTTWLLLTSEGLTGAATAIHRSVIDTFGPIPEDVYVEDRIIPLRASVLGKIAFIDEPLLGYRRHGGNFSANLDQYTDFGAFQKEISSIRSVMPATLTHFLDDLTKLAELCPQRAVALSDIRKKTEWYLSLAEHELALLQGTKLSGLHSLLSIAAMGVGPRALLRDALITFFPRLVYVSRKIRTST